MDKVNAKGRKSPRVSLSPLPKAYQALHRKNKGYTKVLQLGNVARKVTESGYAGLKLPDIQLVHKKSVRGSQSQIRVQPKSPPVDAGDLKHEVAANVLTDISEKIFTKDQQPLVHAVSQVDGSPLSGCSEETLLISGLLVSQSEKRFHCNKRSVGVTTLHNIEDEPLWKEKPSVDITILGNIEDEPVLKEKPSVDTTSSSNIEDEPDRKEKPSVDINSFGNVKDEPLWKEKPAVETASSGNIEDKPVMKGKPSVDTTMIENSKAATGCPKAVLELKKKVSFDKEKFTSALTKIKQTPADKENPKSSHHKISASGKIVSFLNNDNQDLIPPSSAKPLEFDDPVTTYEEVVTEEEQETDRQNKRKHPEKNLNYDIVKKSRCLSVSSSNNHHSTQLCDKVTLSNEHLPLASIKQPVNKLQDLESKQILSPRVASTNRIDLNNRSSSASSESASEKSDVTARDQVLKQPITSSSKMPSSENKGAKRTARKTINRNKFSLEERKLLEKYKTDELKDSPKKTLNSLTSVERNQMMIIDSLTRHLKVDLSPPTDKKLVPTACHIVKNVPRPTDQLLASNGSKSSTFQTVETSLESTMKTSTCALSERSSKPVENSVTGVPSSTVVDSQKRPLKDASFVPGHKVPRIDSSNDGVNVPAAFESKNLDNFLKSVGFTGIESCETIKPTSPVSSKNTLCSAETLSSSALNVNAHMPLQKCTEPPNDGVKVAQKETDSNCTTAVSKENGVLSQETEVQKSLPSHGDTKAVLSSSNTGAKSAEVGAKVTEDGTENAEVFQLDATVKEESDNTISIVNVRSLVDPLLEDGDVEITDKCYLPHAKTKRVGFYKFPNGSKIATIYKNGKLFCAAHELVIWLKINIGSLTQVKCSDNEATLIRMVGRGNLKENFEFKIVPLTEILDMISSPSDNLNHEKIKSEEVFSPRSCAEGTSSSAEKVTVCNTVASKAMVSSEGNTCQTARPKTSNNDKSKQGGVVQALTCESLPSSISSISTSESTSKLSVMQRLSPPAAILVTQNSFSQVIHQPPIVTVAAKVVTESISQCSAEVSTPNVQAPSLPDATSASSLNASCTPPSLPKTATEALTKSKESTTQSANAGHGANPVLDTKNSHPETKEDNVDLLPLVVLSPSSGIVSAVSITSTMNAVEDTSNTNREQVAAETNPLSTAKSQKLLPVIDSYCDLFADSISDVTQALETLRPIRYVSVMHRKRLNQHTLSYMGKLTPNLCQFSTKTPFIIECVICGKFFSPLNFMMHIEEKDSSQRFRVADLLSESIVMDPAVVTSVDNKHVAFWNLFVDWFQLAVNELRVSREIYNKKVTVSQTTSNSLSSTASSTICATSSSKKQATKVKDPFSEFNKFAVPASPAPYNPTEDVTADRQQSATAVSNESMRGRTAQPSENFTTLAQHLQVQQAQVQQPQVQHPQVQQAQVQPAQVQQTQVQQPQVQQTQVQQTQVQQPQVQQTQVQQTLVQQPQVQQTQVQQAQVQQPQVQQPSQTQQSRNKQLQMARPQVHAPARQRSQIQQHAGLSPRIQSASNQPVHQSLAVQQQHLAHADRYGTARRPNASNCYEYSNSYVIQGGHLTATRTNSDPQSYSHSASHLPANLTSQPLMPPPQNAQAMNSMMNNYRIQPAISKPSVITTQPTKEKAAEHYQRSQHYQHPRQPRADSGYPSNTQGLSNSLTVQNSVTVTQHNTNSSSPNTTVAAGSSSPPTVSAHVERFNKAMVQQRMSMLSIEETVRCLEQDNSSLRSQLTTERREKQDYAIKLQKALAESQSKDMEIRALREQLGCRIPR